ncbi:MAG TPA: 50S ribosomal protein L17, partial [Flavipsychrobacter sp.]|nr:50S ribosomal protein L17 [Flavipsychrobacter sp.]
RRALMSNMACNLIEHKRIVTTLAKAKALRVYAEPLITRSKDDSMHNRRVVFSYLQNKEAIKELFGVIGDKVANRPGGYTRIIKLQPRMGDAAEMAMIELVDFNEIYGKDTKDAGAKKTRRSRRAAGTKKAETTTVAAEETTTETVADAPASEAIVVTEEPTTPEASAPEATAEDTNEEPKA